MTPQRRREASRPRPHGGRFWAGRIHPAAAALGATAPVLGLLAQAIASDSPPAKSDAGVTYKNERVARVPWSIHVVTIDRSRKDLTFHAALARGTVLGVSLIADQARAVPRELGRAVAGINGDFYLRDDPHYAGDPRGLQIVNGELVSGPDTVCVWFDARDNPHLDEVKGDFQITWPGGRKTPFGLNQVRRPNTAVLYTPTYGPSTRMKGGTELVLERAGDGPWLPLQAGQTYRARVREVRPSADTRLVRDIMVLSLDDRLAASLPEIAAGTVVEISTATTPDLKGVKTAIGGGPALIRNGRPFSQKTAPPGTSNSYGERSKYERHPRSAIGWSPTHIYLVTVDGRQPGLSVGMKLAELAEYLAALGCTEAMNFDGGKSAQLWMNGEILNSPCQGEDTVANSLLVVRKPAER
ncbi:MAG TPA: phosphodiester glycosidase family protein [Methylomirabilota bacterium]|nr:phosphodiester glycosidase family protein [Methylomirabilota bacterium]